MTKELAFVAKELRRGPATLDYLATAASLAGLDDLQLIIALADLRFIHEGGTVRLRGKNPEIQREIDWIARELKQPARIAYLQFQAERDGIDGRRLAIAANELRAIRYDLDGEKWIRLDQPERKGGR